MRFNFTPLYLVILLVAATLPLAARAQESAAVRAASGTKRVESKRHRFSLVPPDGWKQATLSRSAFLEFVGPTEQKAPNVNVRVLAYDGGDVHELCAAVKNALSGGKDEWTPVSESFLEIDGHKAFFLTATQVNTSQGIRFQTKMLQCFIGDKPDGFIMIYSCLPDLFDELRPSFEKSAKSVRITKR